jgi:hypothetical protein
MRKSEDRAQQAQILKQSSNMKASLRVSTPQRIRTDHNLVDELHLNQHLCKSDNKNSDDLAQRAQTLEHPRKKLASLKRVHAQQQKSTLSVRRITRLAQ